MGMLKNSPLKHWSPIGRGLRQRLEKALGRLGLAHAVVPPVSKGSRVLTLIRAGAVRLAVTMLERWLQKSLVNHYRASISPQLIYFNRHFA